MRDVRCAMVNFDPDRGSPAPEVMRAVVRANQNNAGIYGAVTRIGRLAVGQANTPHAGGEERKTGTTSPPPGGGFFDTSAPLQFFVGGWACAAGFPFGTHAGAF